MKRQRGQTYPEPTVGGLVLNRLGQLLLVRSPKWKRRYTIPGGHVELGETLVEALKRELREEVGLSVEGAELLIIQEAIFSEEFYRRRHFIFFDYMCRSRSSSVKVDGVEIIGYKWVRPERALDMRIDTFTRRSVEALLERLHERP